MKDPNGTNWKELATKLANECIHLRKVNMELREDLNRANGSIQDLQIETTYLDREVAECNLMLDEYEEICEEYERELGIDVDDDDELI